MLARLSPIIPERNFTRDEIAAAMDALLDPAVEDNLKAAFLTAWAQRKESAGELAACAEVLLPRAANPGVRGAWRGKPLLDCCGTGGGGLNLLNISTGMVFVLAALGIPVVKHGNRGLTKKSGSADVLEALGIRIDLPSEKLKAGLDEVGAAFLFAPAYHTGFSVLAQVRRRLGEAGRRTVFNLLGPLLNPARPDARLVGVFQPGHAELYYETLAEMGCANFVVAWGEDSPTMKPIGEVSAHGTTLLLGNRSEPDHAGRTSFNLTVPGDITDRLEHLLVADARESAHLLEALLSNHEKTGLARETLVLNAGVAAWAHGSAASIAQGRKEARRALDSGDALAVLHRWREFSAKA